MDVRKLILKLALFAALFVPLSFGFNALYKATLAPSHLERMEATANARANDIRYLFLGDSHARHAIDTSVIPGSFVYAGRGEFYMQNFFRLRDFVAQNGPPPCVVLESDPHSLSGYRSGKVMDPEYWVDRMELDTLQDVSGISWLAGLRARYFSYVGKWRRVLYSIHPRLPDFIRVEGLGWMPVERAVNLEEGETLEEDAKLAAGFHFDGYPKPDPGMEKWLIRIGKLCEEKGIQLVLLSYPLSEAYMAEWGQRADVSQWKGHEDSLGRRFDTALKLSFRDAFRGQPGLFYDSHHLNVEGARKFSEMLLERLYDRR